MRGRKRLKRAALCILFFLSLFSFGAYGQEAYAKAVPVQSGQDAASSALPREKPDEGKADAVVFESAKMIWNDGGDGHSHAYETTSNRTPKAMIGRQYGMLAFDKDGNPLKIRWNPFDSESGNTYYYEHASSSEEILPGGTAGPAGWSLNFWNDDPAVKEIAYVLYCHKEITFEDGTVWTNPEYAAWRDAYEGKQADAGALKRYYPYSQEIKREDVRRSGVAARKKAGEMTGKDLSQAFVGLQRDAILDAWGEPDGTLSGMYGDIYVLSRDGRRVVFYYDAGGAVQAVKAGEGDGGSNGGEDASRF